MARNKTVIGIEDVGGTFRAFLKNAPRETRAYIHDAVEKTAFSMQRRMEHLAPKGPDAPHIKDALTYKRRGQRAQIGLLDATQPASPGSSESLADVGLFNEYNPNKQPFMRPAAESENAPFTKRVSDAMRAVEGKLSIGGGGGLL
jgi:hypothetical protein